jgi:hypothetical protein
MSREKSMSVEQQILEIGRMEARARRAARRVGLVARKSRGRVGTPDNLGGFAIIDPSTNSYLLGWSYDLDPEDVIEFCALRDPTKSGESVAMTASSRVDRVLALRSAALEVLGAETTMVEVQGLPGRFPSASTREIDILHRTPFQRIPGKSRRLKDAGASPRQRGHRAPMSLPYGLDIWFRQKRVLSVEWSADDAELNILSFRRGRWEDALIGSAIKTGR